VFPELAELDEEDVPVDDDDDVVVLVDEEEAEDDPDDEELDPAVTARSVIAIPIKGELYE
jgi:hypothetical protein